MSGENSGKLIGDPEDDGGDEDEESSSFSSGMLGISGYSKSCWLLSSKTFGRVGPVEVNL